jgi:hypothetical protein
MMYTAAILAHHGGYKVLFTGLIAVGTGGR